MHKLVSHVSQALWSLMSFPIVLGLSLMPSLKYVAPTTGAADLFIMTGVGVVTAYAIPEVRSWCGSFVDLPTFNWRSYPVFLSVAIYTFEGRNAALHGCWCIPDKYCRRSIKTHSIDL